jgi:hypothetical protein
MERAVAPGQPGRPTVDGRLVIDRAAVERAAVERAAVVLSQVGPAAVRGIQECLAEVLGVERSVGWVEGVLQEAARRADAVQATPEGPRQVAADEVYAGRQPVLEVVEPRNGVVLTLERAARRDETAWGCAWLDLEERGVRIDGVVADGAEGLRAGAGLDRRSAAERGQCPWAAGVPGPRLDHWHTLRDLGRVARVLEHSAYRHSAAAERAERATAEAAYRATHGRGARRGRPLGGAIDPATMRAAAQATEEAMARADGVAWVLAALRDALRPVDPATGRVRTRDAVAGDLRAAAALLRELGGARHGGRHPAGAAGRRPDRLPRRPGPRARRPPRRALPGGRRVRGLGLAPSAGARAAPRRRRGSLARQPGRRALGLGRPRRSRARLGHGREPQQRPGRPPRRHRGLPQPILAVWRVYRNHRTFPRGKRAGHSPLDLAGLPTPHWLDALGYGRVLPSAPQFSAHPTQTVNTLAA